MSCLHAGPYTDGLYTVSMDDFVVSASPIASAPVGAKVLAKLAIPVPQQQSNFCTGKGYRAGCTITSYYYFNGQRVAMRVQSDANPTGVVTWLHGDMLGSASVATDAGGNKIAGSDARYMPFGEARSGFAGSGLPTDRRFTGQISVAGGLIDMNARALDPLLGRFISADTIVPNFANPQSLNRYAMTLNNPLRYVDPTGHYACENACDSDSFRTLNYQRSVYSSKFQRRSPESIGKFAELAGKKAFLLGAGVFNAAVWLQRAGIALINFAVGSGAGHGIDVDDILLSSTTHRKVILDQNAQVIQKANAAILGSGRNRRVSAFVASSGTGQGGQAGNWQYTLTDGKQNPDIQAAYGGLDIATTARVSAVKRGNVWDVTLTITTYVEDPYDWEDYDVATSVSLAPALPSPFPWAGLNNQSDMSELHQYGFAQEYLRSGSSTFTLNYSLVP